MDLECHRLCSITGDPFVEPGGAAGDHTLNAKAAACSHDVRKVDVAPHRGAGDDQFARLGELQWRTMTDVFEAGHAVDSLWRV